MERKDISVGEKCKKFQQKQTHNIIPIYTTFKSYRTLFMKVLVQFRDMYIGINCCRANINTVVPTLKNS